MTRLERLDVAALTEPQRALYDTISGGPRGQGPQAFPLTDAAGRLQGPFNAMLLSPAFGTALQAVGRAARYDCALGDRAREIAILVVAHHWHSGFEVYAHEAVGRTVGLTEGELSALRAGAEDRSADDGGPPYGGLVDEIERLVAQTAHALTARSDLDEDEYRAAEAVLGPRALFELTTVVGYYAILALQLRVYRVPVPG